MLIPESGEARQPQFAFETTERLEISGIAPFYRTAYGDAYLGDSLNLLRALGDGTANAVVTSPPYALHFKKEYGNAEKRDYVDCVMPFAAEIFRVLTDDGSFF